MQITNDTTAWQIAELMGSSADEQDGQIMLSLLRQIAADKGWRA